MFNYVLTSKDQYWASNQAEAYSSDNENRKKGNRGEIAFYHFCRRYLPVSCWNWKTGESIRRGEAEYEDYDFELFDRTVDVKTRQEVFDFSPEKFFSDTRENPEDIEADIVVMTVLFRKESQVMILGWVDTEELIEEWRDSGYFGEKGGLEHTPSNSLASLLPGAEDLTDDSVSEFDLHADSREFELGERVVDEIEDDEVLIVEQVDRHAHDVFIDGDETKVSEYEDNQQYSPHDLVLGVTYEVEKYQSTQAYKLASKVTDDGGRVYHFPVGRLSGDVE